MPSSTAVSAFDVPAAVVAWSIMSPLERAAALLSKSPGVKAAYAFGSVAEGRAHRESDLDLAVLLDWVAFPDRVCRGRYQVELIGELMSHLGRNDIDLVILNDAPPLLGRRIVRAGRRLCVADAAAAHAFERDIQLRAADLEPFVRRGRARVLDALRR
jgi:predicted nucleotidyltransferase